MITERVIIGAECWLRAVYAEMRMYRLSRVLGLAIAALDPNDGAATRSLRSIENVQHARSLVAVHNRTEREEMAAVGGQGRTSAARGSQRLLIPVVRRVAALTHRRCCDRR